MIKPTDQMINVIFNFPTPTNITGARYGASLVNQVTYAFPQAKVMASFRELLGKNKRFYCDSNLKDIFQKSKLHIVQQIIEGVKRSKQTDRLVFRQTGAKWELDFSYCNSIVVVLLVVARTVVLATGRLFSQVLDSQRTASHVMHPSRGRY